MSRIENDSTTSNSGFLFFLCRRDKRWHNNKKQFTPLSLVGNIQEVMVMVVVVVMLANTTTKSQVCIFSGRRHFQRWWSNNRCWWRQHGSRNNNNCFFLLVSNWNVYYSNCLNFTNLTWFLYFSCFVFATPWWPAIFACFHCHNFTTLI